METSKGINRTYTLNGSIEELMNILQTEFKFDKKLAEFYLYMLLPDQEVQTECSVEDIHDFLILDESNKYQTNIFNLRFSISFSDVGKDLLRAIFVQAAGLLFNKDSIAFKIIIECLVSLFRNGTYIEDNECCPYYQAIKWKYNHRTSDYFSVKDILPNPIDGFCIHLDCINDKKWMCHYCNEESCNANEDKFRRILDNLCKRKVFIKNDENMYRFSK